MATYDAGRRHGLYYRKLKIGTTLVKKATQVRGTEIVTRNFRFAGNMKQYVQDILKMPIQVNQVSVVLHFKQILPALLFVIPQFRY